MIQVISSVLVHYLDSQTPPVQADRKIELDQTPIEDGKVSRVFTEV